MAEGEIGSWHPFKTQKNVSVGLIVGGVFMFLIGLGVLDEYSICSGLIGSGACGGTLGAAIFFLLIGVLLIFLAIRSKLFGKPKVRYVLTNRRALVYSESKQGQSVLQSADLSNCTVSVLNRSTISQSQGRSYGVGGGGLVGLAIAGAGGGASSMVSNANQVGDVVFFVGGLPTVRFVGVQDPDGISQTAVMAINNLRGVR